MKAHDLALLIKLSRLGEKSKPNQVDLAKSLHVSQSEISDGIKRLVFSRLLNVDKATVDKKSLLEYLVYGARYHFPVELGKPAIGIPTGYSNPIYKHKIQADFHLVWPYEGFKNAVRGISVKPLYPNLPKACIGDLSLYAIFSAFDMLRVGETQERALAIEVLEKQLL